MENIEKGGEYNGKIISTGTTESIGMHEQNTNPYEPFKTSGDMRRSHSQSKIFDNNGGTNKGSAGGVVSGDYAGPVSFGAP